MFYSKENGEIMKKNIIVWAAAIIMSPLSAISAVVGDINGDDRINLSEAIYALRVSAGLSPQPFSTVISAIPVASTTCRSVDGVVGAGLPMPTKCVAASAYKYVLPFKVAE